MLGCWGFAGHAGLAVAVPAQSESERIGASTLATLDAEPLRGLRASAAGLLLQAPDGGAIPVAPLLVELDDEPLTVSFLLEVAGDALVARAPTDSPEAAGNGAAETRRLEIYAYLLGSGGEVLAHRAGAVSLAGVAPWSALEKVGPGISGLRIAGSLRSEGATTKPERLRLLVLDPVSNRHGLATLPIDLGSAARWPPPSFTSEGAWLVVDLGGATTGTNAGARSARPVLLAGRGYAFDLAPGESDGTAPEEPDALRWSNLRALLRPILRPERPPARANDRTPQQTPLEASARGRPGPALTVDVEIPRNLQPGAYHLEVAFEERGIAVATVPIEVWIADAEMLADAEGLTWPSLLRVDSPTTSRAATTGARSPKKSPKADAQTARYLELLTQADSNEATSLDGLLELLVAAGDGTEASRDLLGAIARGAVRLVEGSDRAQASSWQILVPLIEHHHRAFLRGFSGGRSSAALNNLDVAEILALLFPPGGVELEGRTLIADALALAARDCERLGLQQRASRLLLAALEVDAGHRSSLELVAFSRERSGDLDGAVEAVERMLRNDPRNRELRLRHAVLAHRRGQPRPADARARALIAERAGDWIEELALEIRASIALEEDDASGAVELLRRAAAEHPGNQRLQILYALALDRSGRQDDADTVLAHAETLEPSGPSPRYRYAQPADSGIVDSRRRLTSALPLLRAQLVEAATRQVPRDLASPRPR